MYGISALTRSNEMYAKPADGMAKPAVSTVIPGSSRNRRRIFSVGLVGLAVAEQIAWSSLLLPMRLQSYHLIAIPACPKILLVSASALASVEAGSPKES